MAVAPKPVEAGMDRTERFYKIDHLLHERKVVPFRDLIDELSVSPATLKRDLEYLRDRLQAPIVWDRDARGYRFAEPPRSGRRYQLPGLWFNPGEIHALLAMQSLLANLDPGILAPQIEPLRARLRAMLGSEDHTYEEVERRVKLIHLAARRQDLKHFEVIGSAVLARKRLYIRHYNRQRNEETEREVSPQRLVHYRENWYLDTWCHKTEELRSFAIDAIRMVRVLGKAAKNIPERVLDEHFKPGYGIFSGAKVQWAKLRFTPERARWVAFERWHEKQKAHYETDGSYVLQVPYSDDRELLMDILKFGPDCEVLGPQALRTRVSNALASAANMYKS
jgi:predicted DNA-binding transcriptional regulator YafY